MRLYLICSLTAFGFAIGCGSSSESAPFGAGGAGQGGAGSVATSGTAMGGGGAAGVGGGGTGGASGCPDAAGYYASIATQGAGCGDIDTNAAACVAGQSAACSFHLVSGSAGGAASVNGQIDVQEDGSFDNAGIILGTVQRTGCTGSVAGTMLTVVCGGTDPTSSQYCKVTLMKTSNSCP